MLTIIFYIILNKINRHFDWIGSNFIWRAKNENMRKLKNFWRTDFLRKLEVESIICFFIVCTIVISIHVSLLVTRIIIDDDNDDDNDDDYLKVPRKSSRVTINSSRSRGGRFLRSRSNDGESPRTRTDVLCTA